MHFFSRLMAVLALVLIASSSEPAVAHPNDAQLPAGTPVRILFAPPLDQTLRFQISIEKYRDGKAVFAAPLVWVEEVRYAKTASGYTLFWRMDPATLPAAMRSPLLAPMVAPYTGTPIAFDVSVDGTILRARDWDEQRAIIKANLTKMRPLFLAEYGDAHAADIDKVIAVLSAQFDTMTAEQAPSIILQNISPIFGWLPFSFTVGEARTVTADMPMPMFNTTVKGTATVTLVSADAQIATVSDREAVDPAELEKALTAMSLKAGGKASAPASTQPVTSMITLVFDRATGIMARFDSESREGTSGPLAQKKVITWQR